MVRDLGLGISLALLAMPAGADDLARQPIRLPSGAEAIWHETLSDDSGGQGLTYRFRFLMADLAQRAPAPEDGMDAPEDQDRGPIDIDTESAEVTGMEDAPPPEDVAQDDTLQPIAAADEGPEVEEAADEVIAQGVAPDAAQQGNDPLRDDVAWLCQNWALPRIGETSPPPTQIVISLSDRKVEFGSYDPEAVQLFEAFALSADHSRCEWEPW